MIPLSAERRWLLGLARRGGDAHFDSATGICLTLRETCWYAVSFLCDGTDEARIRGNRLLQSIRSEDGTHTPATMIALLRAIPENLDAGVSARLRDQVAAEIVHAAETEWKDGNVNHPLGAYCTLICGGEMSQNAWATRLGVRRLARLHDRIGTHRSVHLRQAEMSEYNSLTYTALDLSFLALIAEYAEDSEARERALDFERGLWIDVAMHFHAPSHQFAGPHSRSYHEDSVGGFSALHGACLAAGFGPMYANPDLSVRFNHPSDLLQNGLTAIIPFHLPPEAIRMAWNKPFPYSFRKTTYGESYHENSRRGDAFAFDEEVYPGGWTDLTTYMTEEYAIGSAARPYVNGGHSDSVMLRIRRTENLLDMSGFRSMFLRGVYNDALPGERNQSHVAGIEVDESYLYEEGRPFTYQHESSVIVAYHPKRAGHKGVRSFCVNVIFGDFAPFDEIALDGKTLSSLPTRARGESVLCFRDFRTYFLIRPIAPVPSPGDLPLLIRRWKEFFVVSLYNYAGEPRDFTRDEINGWRSGLVIEIRNQNEFSSWDDFLRYAEGTMVEESVGSRGVRNIRYVGQRGVMEFAVDPFREGIVSRRWNGREDAPDHLEVFAAGLADGPYCPRTLFGRERK